MPGFHTRYTGMPGLNSYSMPGSATCDTGHKALCPVSTVCRDAARTQEQGRLLVSACSSHGAHARRRRRQGTVLDSVPLASAPPFAPPFAPFESGLVFAVFAAALLVFAVFAVSALVFALLHIRIALCHGRRV